MTKKIFKIGFILLLVTTTTLAQVVVNPRVLPPASTITPTVATGTTVLTNNILLQTVYKVTVARTAFVTAGTTSDVTLATLPAKTKVLGVIGDLTQTFACTAVCTSSTLSMTAGTSAGGTQYLLSFDADAAAAQFGLTNATSGAQLVANLTQGGDVPSWASTTTVSVRLTSGTGNIGNGVATNLSQGSITFYIITTILP